MNNIFIGMIFVFLNFNIDIGASRIGLIPDFLGYFFMLRGVAELVPFSPRFERIRPFIAAMAVYTAVLYFFDILGFSSSDGTSLIGIILGLAAFCFSLYISYQTVMGVRDIEMSNSWDLNGAELYSVWKIRTVLQIILYALVFIPALALIGILASLVVSIYFLMVFNRTKNMFYELNR